MNSFVSQAVDNVYSPNPLQESRLTPSTGDAISMPNDTPESAAQVRILLLLKVTTNIIFLYRCIGMSKIFNKTVICDSESFFLPKYLPMFNFQSTILNVCM